MPLASHVSADTALQLMQVAPAAPHSASDRVSHVLPLQQPPGHEVASHTSLPHAPASLPGSHAHLPEAQRCPAPHAELEPQVHAPDAPQPSLVVASHPLQTHAPFVQLCPGGHERPPVHAGPRLP